MKIASYFILLILFLVNITQGQEYNENEKKLLSIIDNLQKQCDENGEEILHLKNDIRQLRQDVKNVLIITTKSQKSNNNQMLQPMWDSYPRVSAFGLHIINSVHDDITLTALASTKLSGIASEIADFVSNVDWEEMTILQQPNKNYCPEHHFDRPANQSHKQAFLSGRKYVIEMQREAIRNLNEAFNNDSPKKREKLMEKVKETIAKGLHAGQDFFAHSNYYELNEQEQKRITSALLLDGNSEEVDISNGEHNDIPTSLKITGYDKNAKNPGEPDKDDYPHNGSAVGHGYQGTADYNKALHAAVDWTTQWVKPFEKYFGKN